MSFSTHHRHAIRHYSEFPDQIGNALNELALPEWHDVRKHSSDYEEIFHALLYLGKSRDYNDQFAFCLLHQIFVILTRHDPDQDLPTLDELWRRAQQKMRETCN